MNKLDKILMLIVFLSSVVSAIDGILNDTTFGWQLICATWVIVCYLKQTTIDSFKKNIDQELKLKK